MSDVLLRRVKPCVALGFTAIVFVLLTAMVSGAVKYTLRPAAFTADIRALSSLTYEIEGGPPGTITLPYTFTGLSPDTLVTLYTEIDAGPRESLYIKTNFTPLRLYVGDELVYECGQNNSYPAFLIDPPTFITTVPLPDTDGAQPLRLEYCFPKQRDLQIPALFVGDEVALLTKVFIRDGFSFLFSILLLFIGVVMTGISMVITHGKQAGSPFLWLGFFVAATGLWILGECDLTAFFIPYPTLLYIMAYTGLITMAIPFLRYGQLVLQPRTPWPLQVMQAVLCAAVTVALALQLAGVVSLARSLFVFHCLVPLAFVIFTLCLAWEYIRYRSAAARRFALPILVLSASSVLEVVNYRFRFTDILSLFFQLGVLFFVISMGSIAGRFAREAQQTAAEKRRLETEVASMGRVLALQREQYAAIAENAEAVKAQRHDLHHQLAVIKDYNHAGEKEKLNDYLEELTANLYTSGERKVCENFAVNAVVLHYVTLAENEGIETSVQLMVPGKTGGVRDSDLSIIVGNFLENAIEACKRMTTGKRFIKLRSRVRDDKLVITMDNSFDGYYQENGELFYSRKRDGQGIGLSSVLAVAKKYGGNAKFEAKGNVFLSSVYVTVNGNKQQA